MKKLATELTDQEKEVFKHTFYNLTEMNDLEADTPFGCPWMWLNGTLQGKDAEEMAKNFYIENKKEIDGLINQDKEIELERKKFEEWVMG